MPDIQDPRQLLRPEVIALLREAHDGTGGTYLSYHHAPRSQGDADFGEFYNYNIWIPFNPQKLESYYVSHLRTELGLEGVVLKPEGNTIDIRPAVPETRMPGLDEHQAETYLPLMSVAANRVYDYLRTDGSLKRHIEGQFEALKSQFMQVWDNCPFEYRHHDGTASRDRVTLFFPGRQVQFAASINKDQDVADSLRTQNQIMRYVERPIAVRYARTHTGYPDENPVGLQIAYTNLMEGRMVFDLLNVR